MIDPRNESSRKNGGQMIKEQLYGARKNLEMMYLEEKFLGLIRDDSKRLRDLVRRLDIGLVIKQQQHHIKAAAHGGKDQGGIPVLWGGHRRTYGV